jgi:tRNA/tmRNA/rRNA uracil-C5-methylase (TrmA/RlmC/RlmD family)
MSGYLEFIDPFDDKTGNIFVRVEHLARYLYAAEFARKRRLRRVLDCACGNGYGSRVLAKAAWSVTGLDVNEEFIAQGRSDAARQGLDNVEFQEVDLSLSLLTVRSIW